MVNVLRFAVLAVATVSLLACSAPTAQPPKGQARQDGATVASTTGPTSSSPSGTRTGTTRDREAGVVVHDAILRTLRESAKVDVRFAIRVNSESYRMFMIGAYDMPNDVGELTVMFPGGAIDRLEERFTPDTVYVRPVANLAATQWAAVPRPPIRTHGILRTPANDPEAVLYRTAWATDVVYVGPTEVNARTATEYRGIIPVHLLTKDFALNQFLKARPLLRQLPRDAVKVSVWVDTNDRVARIVHRFTFSDSAGLDMQSRLQLTLSEPGTTVRVTRPRSAQQMPSEDLRGALIG